MKEQVVKVDFKNAPTKAEMLCQKLNYILDGNANHTKEMYSISIKYELMRNEQTIKHKNIMIDTFEEHIAILKDQLELSKKTYKAVIKRENNLKDTIIKQVQELLR